LIFIDTNYNTCVPKLPSLTVFYPCYNERENIDRVIDETLRVIPQIAEDYEIIVVDDGSRDGTDERVTQRARSDPRLRLVRHPVNRGYGEALKSGFRAARMKWVFYTDGDGQFDLADLPRLVEQSSSADIVSGFRSNRADPVHRKWNAFIFAIACRLFLGVRVPDIDCAFKLYRREVLDQLTLKTTGAMINAEIFAKASRAGYRIVSLPVQHRPRVAGTQTGAKWRVILRAMREFWVLWADL
jgi:glycosyltransferase involved in cell wall biosynthesis